jgi:predicted dehydrogenase/threonine dehydrogenase-like Zn-dependent dehydrogenase
MKQIAQNYKSGSLGLVEVPPPALQAGMVRVRTVCSLVSPGTEGTKVSEAKMSLLQKARARPEQVKQVLATMKQQGVKSTYHKVMNKLDSLSPLGYSASGVVEAIGDGVEGFHVGQKVAIAGAGYANHAEVNVVPKQLCAPVPEGVDMAHAAFTTMGIIALHGFRQGEMRLGETAVVIGLGMVGQLVGQMAMAAGVNVIGIDLDAERCATARACGFAAAGSPSDANIKESLKRLTGGAGADVVFLALGTSSNQPLMDALGMVRDKGRIVCVGVAKMDVPYNQSFKKEIDFRFSRSYGPGRYDPNYEELGRDYPIGYVRWTEGRNMGAVLSLMAQGKLSLDPLMSQRAAFADAPELYDKMYQGELGGLSVVFDYGDAPASEPNLSIVGSGSAKRDGQLGIGCIGVGNYAASMLLPHLKSDQKVSLVEVANATALSSKNAADKFGFARGSTDAKAIIKAEDIDAVIIATRHATHAQLTIEALAEGKAVFVEKPLAIKTSELSTLEALMARMESPQLHVGFNRRFAPIMQALKAALPSDAPLAMHYRVHAGPMDATHWIRQPEQGGRFIGEAGHFFDVFAYLTGAKPVSVSAQRIDAPNAADDDRDNFVVSVRYADGSIATLHYLTQGAKGLPKEWLEVTGGGITAQMQNFAELALYKGSGAANIKKGYGNNKGQKEQLQAVLKAWQEGGDMPISLECLMDTSWLTLAAFEAASDNRVIDLSEYARPVA